MRSLLAATCPKDLQYPHENEDKFCVGDNAPRIALCDGASESYDSRTWADILACQYVQDEKVTPAWLDAAQQRYRACHDIASMSWSQYTAYERGSFATLIGVEYNAAHQDLDILAIGDSLTILCDGNQFIASWPFSDPDDFKRRPTLLSTRVEHCGFVGESDFWHTHTKTWQLSQYQQPRLLCMTDALGEWALKEVISGGQGLATLLAMTSEAELIAFVLAQRIANRMRIDDATLIILAFDSTDSTGNDERDVPQL